MSENNARLDLDFVYQSMCDLIEKIDAHEKTREESDATLIKRIKAKLDIIARSLEIRYSTFHANTNNPPTKATHRSKNSKWKARYMDMMNRFEEIIATSENPCVKYGDEASRGYRKGMNDTLIILIAIFTGENSPALRELPPELEMVRELRGVVSAIYDSSLLALRGKSDYRNTLYAILSRCSGLVERLEKFKMYLPMLQKML